MQSVRPCWGQTCVCPSESPRSGGAKLPGLFQYQQLLHDNFSLSIMRSYVLFGGEKGLLLKIDKPKRNRKLFYNSYAWGN